MEYVIDDMKFEDWPRVEEIYAEGIDSGISTFRSHTPTWEQWDSQQIKSCRLVAKSASDILGWAALSNVSTRCVYGGVAEVSIYVDSKYKGLGIATKLLNALIKKSESEGFWTLQSTIIVKNIPSLNLHTKCGFRTVGLREKIAKSQSGQWLDTVIVERRSTIVGAE